MPSTTARALRGEHTKEQSEGKCLVFRPSLAVAVARQRARAADALG